jgi:type VI secretion system protein ImpE
MPARFVWANGGEAFGFLPTRYPGSQAAEDPALALSGRTEWRERGTWQLGLGQRMLATDGGEFAVMDVRRIELAEVAEPAEPQAAEA